MKKIIPFLLLVSLCSCTNNSKTNKNTNVIEQSKYARTEAYVNVRYRFDEYMRCVVHYDHYKGDDESGYVLDYTKDWCVYLTGFYTSPSNNGMNYFAECYCTNGTIDYYLVLY